MTGCHHPNPIPHAVLYTLGEPGALVYVVAMHVVCPACEHRLRFLGAMPSQPDDVNEAIIDGRGAWVTDDKLELAVMVAPDVPTADDLLNAVPMGRA